MNIKGAAFTLATMCDSQKAPVDMLMYYDARPTFAWNGMFDMSQIGRSTLKGYYPFPMFNTLYRMGTEVESSSDDGVIHTLAARDGDKGALILAHYNDDDTAPDTEVSLSFGDLGGATEAKFDLLDSDNDLTLTQSITFQGTLNWKLRVPNFTCYLVILNRA